MEYEKQIEFVANLCLLHHKTKFVKLCTKWNYYANSCIVY